ncbi:hypothetical protein BJ170DRAFT_683229 [Xylariales sp. AK1849]|nr:hypothetical protein BJ170DRAFT_683229 [Xylariales sp. AK1849]
MQYKQLISALAVVACGATTAAALEHGDFADHQGLVIRYHQLARDVFTGVPADAWDDEIHQRSDEVWDEAFLAARSYEEDSLSKRDFDFIASRSPSEALAELENRNIKDTCQAIVVCAKDYTVATVSAGYWGWVAAARYAASTHAGQGIIEFLNTPFVANAAGVAVAGVISGQINGAGGSSCSTSGSDADVVGAAVAAAVAAKPGADEVAITIKGPSGGSWTITVAAGSANTTPAAVCK